MRGLATLMITLIVGSSFFIAAPLPVEAHGRRGHRHGCCATCCAPCGQTCEYMRTFYPPVWMYCDGYVWCLCQSGQNCQSQPSNQLGQPCGDRRPPVTYGSNIKMYSDNGAWRPCQTKPEADDQTLNTKTYPFGAIIPERETAPAPARPPLRKSGCSNTTIRRLATSGGPARRRATKLSRIFAPLVIGVERPARLQKSQLPRPT